MYEILQTQFFNRWYSKQEIHIRTIIDARVELVRNSGVLINSKYLGDKLFEFRWKIGIRVYFTVKGNRIILLLNGGTKNGQEKDIQKSRILQKTYTF